MLWEELSSYCGTSVCNFLLLIFWIYVDCVSVIDSVVLEAQNKAQKGSLSSIIGITLILPWQDRGKKQQNCHLASMKISESRRCLKRKEQCEGG